MKIAVMGDIHSNHIALEALYGRGLYIFLYCSCQAIMQGGGRKRKRPGYPGKVYGDGGGEFKSSSVQGVNHRSQEGQNAAGNQIT